MALTSAQRVELIQKMYVAYYGRPADTGGLDNWINHLAQHNDDASAIIQAFGTSPEATSLYGEPVNYALAVNALYMQMFNRPAEPDGLALYVAHLNAGRVTLPNLALVIATGAQNSDAATLANKIEVATAFTAEVATSTDNILGYAGADAAAHAAAYLASVTNTDASVTDALAELNSTIDMINHLDQLSSLPTHELTTGLDNLLGTNGNDVVLANLTDGPNGEEANLELDDAFNALGGNDTLRLDAWGNFTVVDFDTQDYQFENFERVLVQGRGDELDLTLNLIDMAGVDLEVRNLDSGADFLTADNVGGNVDVVNFDGIDININTVGGDITLSDIVADGNIDINYVDGSVSLISVDNNIEGNEQITIDYISGDTTLTNVDADWISLWDTAGDVTLTNVDANDNINIHIVGGDVVLNNVNAHDDSLNITQVAGDVTISDTYVDYNTMLIDIGGDVTLTDVNANENLNIVFASDLTDATVNLTNVLVDTEIHINGVNTLDADGNVLANGGDLTAVTLNIGGEDGVDANGIELKSYQDESSEESNISSLTINAAGNLTVDYVDFAYQGDSNSNENAIATTLTVNGAGDVALGGVYLDAYLDVVYTGSGSLSFDGFNPTNGSINASRASGDVTVELDLNEAFDDALDFTYVGSKGDDRVTISEDSLGDSATDADTIQLSLAGGAGTDTLVVSDDYDLNADAMAAVSGFEVLELTDFNDNETYDLADAHEFTSVVLRDGNSDDNNVNIVNMSAVQADNITIHADGYDFIQGGDGMFNDLTIALEDATGANDSVTLNIIAGEEDYYDSNIDSNDNLYQVVNDDLILDDIENLSIDTQFEDDNSNTDAVMGIQNIDANELETLTITGEVSLDINNINSDQLRLIDATGFTGAVLDLAWDGEDGSVNTDDDITINGSLTANHFIDVNGNEDVTITTGSGDDNIYVEWGIDVTVTTGSGDDNIDINRAEGDAIVNAGAGVDDVNINFVDGNLTVDTGADDDSVYIDYVLGDATVTLGDGNDDFNYNYNDIHGDLVVNAGAGDDNINIHLDSDGNIDSATVTLGAGADELWLEDTHYAAANDVVVTVTDFSVADDVVYLDEAAAFGEGAEYATVETQDGDYDLTEISDSNVGVVEFVFAADNNGVTLDINSNGSDLLEALGDDGNEAIITVNDDQEGYIVAYNGGNAFIFNFLDTAETNPGVEQAGHDDGYWEDPDGDYEDWSFLVSSGQEGFDIGDQITIYNIDGAVDLTYTVQTDNASLTTVMSGLAALVNGLAGRDYNASYDANGYLYLTSISMGDWDDVVGMGYNNVADTATVDAGEIELVAVLENVTAGSLSTDAIGFYDWNL